MRVNVLLKYLSSEYFELRTKWRPPAIFFNLQVMSDILTIFLQNSGVLYSYVSGSIFFQLIMGSYYSVVISGPRTNMAKHKPNNHNQNL